MVTVVYQKCMGPLSEVGEWGILCLYVYGCNVIVGGPQALISWGP